MGFINELSRRVQASTCGIPPLGAKLFKLVAVRIISKLHESVADEVISTLEQGAVLDVGCGTGSLLSKVGEGGGPRYYLVGLDISEAMARIARSELSKLSVLHDVVIGDAHELPLRSESVDAVISTGTLHHLMNPRKFFLECVRVLKRGGKALIYELSPDVSLKELVESARTFRKPAPLLKIVSTLHGIPRKEFTEGRMKEALRGVKHRVLSKGITTEVLIVK